MGFKEILLSDSHDVFQPISAEANIGDIGNWQETFELVDEPTEEDINSYLAGVFLHERFSKVNDIRDELFEFFSMPEADFIQLVVGGFNRFQKVLFEDVLEDQEDTSEFHFTEFLTGRLRNHSADVGGAHVENVEAAYELLKSISNSYTPSSSSHDFEEDKLVGDLWRLKKIAHFKHALKTFWNRCMWNDWGFAVIEEDDELLDDLTQSHLPEVERENLDIYRGFASDLEFEKQRTVGNFRYKKLMTEDVEYLKRSGSSRTTTYWSVEQNINSNSCMNFSIENKSYYTHELPVAYFQKQAIEESYLGPFLETQLVEDINICLEKYIDFWLILDRLSNKLLEEYPSDTGIQSYEKLSQFAPKFKEQEFVRKIADAMDITHFKAKEIVRFFVFDPDESYDLWSNPLIKLDDEWVTLFVSSLSGNPRVLVEEWLKRESVNIGEKGTELENLIQKDVNDKMANSKIFQECGSLNRNVEIDDEDFVQGVDCTDSELELDLIFWVRDKIFIGEIKCKLFPTRAYDYNHLRDEFLEFSESIREKVEDLQDHKEFFLSNHINPVISRDFQLDEVTLCPVLITNQQFLVGESLNEVPIIDTAVINTMFRDGGKYQIELTPDSARAVNFESFYDNEKEAYENLFQNLKAPPYIENYKESVETYAQQIPGLSDDSFVFFLDSFNINIPEFRDEIGAEGPI